MSQQQQPTSSLNPFSYLKQYFCQKQQNPSSQTPPALSHILLSISCCILIAFSLTSSIALFTINAKYSGLAGIDGLIGIVMTIAVIISVLSVGAIISSWRKISMFLNFYQFVCLVLGVIFVVLLVGVGMTGMQNYQSSNQNMNHDINTGTNENNLLESCYTPSNYFQYKMLQISNKASNLLCSSTCPCPQYKKVQQCPGWQTNPYELIMQQLQQQFSCSGWCGHPAQNNNNINGSNTTQVVKPRYMFRQNIQENVGQEIVGSCHSQWVKWIKIQWSSVIGCISVMVVIFLVNILLTNWRILQIWNKDEEI